MPDLEDLNPAARATFLTPGRRPCLVSFFMNPKAFSSYCSVESLKQYSRAH